MSKMNSFKSRAFRAGGYSFAAALIVLVVLVAINAVMGAIPTNKTRLDITEQKLSTLSPLTENVLQIMDKEITFTWLVQEGNEDPVVEELLNRYADASGYIKLEKEDPAVNPILIENLGTDYYDNSILATCGDRQWYVSYSDMFIEEEDFSTGEQTYTFMGENTLTQAIYYMATEDVPCVYYITGHGESQFPAEAKYYFNTCNVELKQLETVKNNIPDDADMIICYRPTKDISAAEQELLMKYLGSGGQFMLVTGNLPAKLTNLEAIMEMYGVQSQTGTVIETNSWYVSDQGYNLLPAIRGHAITDPYVKAQYRVMVPLARGLQVVQNGTTTAKVTKLLETSESSYAKTNPNFTNQAKAEGDVDGPFCLGVAIEDQVVGTKVVWFSSDYILDPNCGTDAMFFNAIAWMCGQEALITVPGKNVTKQILLMEQQSIKTMTWIIVAIIPLGYLTIGATIYSRRKKR